MTLRLRVAFTCPLSTLSLPLHPKAPPQVLYEMRKKAKTAAKQQREQQRLADPKEVRIGCRAAPNDLALKVGRARAFLEEGQHLRLSVLFKGARELAEARGVVLSILAHLEGASSGLVGDEGGWGPFDPRAGRRAAHQRKPTDVRRRAMASEWVLVPQAPLPGSCELWGAQRGAMPPPPRPPSLLPQAWRC